MQWRGGSRIAERIEWRGGWEGDGGEGGGGEGDGGEGGGGTGWIEGSGGEGVERGGG